MEKKKQYSQKYNRLMNYLKRFNDAMLNHLVLATVDRGNYPVGLRQYYESLWAVALVPKDKNKRARNSRKSMLTRMRNSQEMDVLKLLEASRLIRQRYYKRFK